MVFPGSMYHSNTLPVQVNTLARAYGIFKQWRIYRFPSILEGLKSKGGGSKIKMEEYIRENYRDKYYFKTICSISFNK